VNVATGPDAQEHYRRANELRAQGELDAALAAYDQAVALDPTFANAYCNRGVTLGQLHRHVEALESFDHAVGQNPGDALAHYNRAGIQRQLAQLDAALASYDRAIEIRPDYAEAIFNRAVLLQELKRWEESLAAMHAALALNPAFPTDQAWGSIASAHAELQHWEEAIAAFDRVIAVNPVQGPALQGRARALHELKRYEEAIAGYDQVLALQPDLRFLPGLRRYAMMHICDWSGMEADIARFSAGLRDLAPVAPPFPLLALLDSAPLQKSAATVWVREVCPPNPTLGPIAKRARPGKIHIGYFSADFRLHPVTLLLAELFEVHDRSRFQITAFAFGPPVDDALRTRLERGFDRFIDVRDKSDMEVAALARAQNIDIAVDLTGFTEYGRTNIFALRAAPVQIGYIGYLGTMGAPYMDYLIADQTIISPEERGNYSEKILYLPIYMANHAKRHFAARAVSRTELGLPSDGFVFACCNANYKLSPATFGGWMRILGRVKGSVLFLNADNTVAERNLRREAAHRGIDPARIVFGARLALPEYMARYRALDLFLDTLPYNAGATASDALWAGVPMLTRAGTTFAGRVAASLLMALQMPELIAADQQQFEDMAVDLATDPARFAHLRERLARQRLASPLFDARAFAMHLESAYEQAVARHYEGLPPDHILPRTAATL
jgi:predicted O-linked N-acetylglucosamine transferase (SPINDLY family)